MEIWPSFYSSASILTICYLLSFALCKSVCNCSSLSLSCRPDGNECWALRVSLCSYFMNPACILIAEY